MVNDFTFDRRRFMQGAAGLALARSGVAPAFAQGAPKRGGVLRVAFPANPSILDPHTGFTGNDQICLFPIYDPLIDWDPVTLEPKPGLAQSWDMSNPNEMVIDLRPNLVFSDGTPCDAAAVKFNLERGKSHPKSVVKPDLASVTSVEVASPTRVVLKLSAPNSSLPALLSDRAGMISSPKAIQEMGDNFGRTVVGIGPWKLVRWVDNEVVEYTRNETYYKKDQVHLDGVRLQIIPETNTALRSVVAGENDIVFRLTGAQITTVKQARGVQLVQAPTLGSYFVYLNRGRPPFDDVNVRQALSYAIDRQIFNQVIFQGLSEPAFTMLPKEHWAYNQALKNPYPHDPEKARALLKKAGKENLAINLIGPSDQPSRQRIEILADHCSKAGINLKITLATLSEASAAFFQQRADCLWSRWTGRPDPSQAWYVNYAADGVTNPSKTPPSDELGKLMVQSRSVADLPGRKAVFAKLEQIVSDEVLGVPVVFDVALDGVANKVKNYIPNLQGKARFDSIWLDG